MSIYVNISDRYVRVLASFWLLFGPACNLPMHSNRPRQSRGRLPYAIEFSSCISNNANPRSFCSFWPERSHMDRVNVAIVGINLPKKREENVHLKGFLLPKVFVSLSQFRFEVGEGISKVARSAQSAHLKLSLRSMFHSGEPQKSHPHCQLSLTL